MDEREYRIQLGHAAAEQLMQYLDTLSAEAWRHPSACEGWEVRDVVGHLTWVAELYAGGISKGVQGDTSPLAGCPPAGTLERAALSAFIAQRSIAQRESLGEQLLTTFTARHAQLYRLFSSLRPQDWEQPCYHPNGIRPAQQFVTMWLTELAMHAWDSWSRLDPARPLFAESLPIFMEGQWSNKYPHQSQRQHREDDEVAIDRTKKPNIGLQATAYSLRSYVAAASSGA